MQKLQLIVWDSCTGWTEKLWFY